MTNQKFAEAAKQLLSRRVPGMKAQGLPKEIAPTSIDGALAVQQEMIKQRTDSVAGWKCLLPLAEDKFIVAPIFSDTIETGAVCNLIKDEGQALVEPEIAFVLNKDLPARDEDYSEQEINDAIGSAHFALELMQKRFAPDAEAEFVERLADCLVNQGLYLGPEIDLASAFKAAEIKLTFTQTDANGDVETKQFDGKHPNPLPQLPVYWVINYLSKRGVTFKKGEAFTTGSYAGIVPVDFDKETVVAYEGLGEYTVTFKEIV